MRPRRKLCFRPGRRRSRTESDTESPMRWKAACVLCCTAMPFGHGIFCLSCGRQHEKERSAMKHLRKLTAVLLAVVLVLALAACG